MLSESRGIWGRMVLKKRTLTLKCRLQTTDKLLTSCKEQNPRHIESMLKIAFRIDEVTSGLSP